MDYNPREQRYNWELAFCELYAGGKYRTNEGENYEYSLGLNGPGALRHPVCLRLYGCGDLPGRDALHVALRPQGKPGGLEKEPTRRKATGTRIRWKPDLEVFTDIDIPLDYYQDAIKRQAVVNAGITFLLRTRRRRGSRSTPTGMRTGLWTMSRSWRGRGPHPGAVLGRGSAGAGPGGQAGI